MSTENRRSEIFKTIMGALTEIGKKGGYDFTRETPETRSAEDDLNEAMANYVEGATSKAHVRTVYQRWRDLHKAGGLV